MLSCEQLCQNFMVLLLVIPTRPVATGGIRGNSHPKFFVPRKMFELKIKQKSCLPKNLFSPLNRKTCHGPDSYVTKIHIT